MIFPMEVQFIQTDPVVREKIGKEMEKITLTRIRHYAWANQGEGEMQVRVRK